MHKSCEGQSHNGLADTNKGQGSTSLSRPNELLSTVHMELLGSVAGTDHPTQERYQIRVDKGGRGILHGIETSLLSGGLPSTIRPRLASDSGDRRIRLRARRMRI